MLKIFKDDDIEILHRLAEEINLIMRGVRGYGSGQPWSPRKPIEGLGKSAVAEFLEQRDDGDSDSGTDDEQSEFRVSKAFLEKGE